MLGKRTAPVVGIAAAAIGIAVASTFLGVRNDLFLLAAVVVAIAAVFAALRFRHVLGVGLGGIQYVAVWIAGLATLFITFNGVRLSSHLTASDALLLLAAAVLLLSVFADRARIPLLPGWLVFGGIGLLVAGFLSTFTSLDLGTNVVATGEFAIALLGVPWILAFVTGSAERLLFIAGAWLASAAINAVVGVSDFLHLTSIGMALVGFVNIDRPTALTIHPNHLGLVCAMTFPIGLYFVTRTPRRRLLWLAALAALSLVALGLLVSGSRAGLLAAAAGGLIFPMLGRKLWRPLLLLAVLAGGILLASSWVTVDQSSSASNPFIAVERLANPDVTVGAANQARLTYYGEAIADFNANPLTGKGFDLVRNAHDIYFQLLQAGGALALIAFVVFATGAIVLGLRLTRSGVLGRDMQNFAAAVTASLAVWLLAGLVQNLVYDRFLYVPIGLLVGLRLFAQPQRAFVDKAA